MVKSGLATKCRRAHLQMPIFLVKALQLFKASVPNVLCVVPNESCFCQLINFGLRNSPGAVLKNSACTNRSQTRTSDNYLVTPRTNKNKQETARLACKKKQETYAPARKAARRSRCDAAHRPSFCRFTLRRKQCPWNALKSRNALKFSRHFRWNRMHGAETGQERVKQKSERAGRKLRPRGATRY